MFGLPPVSAGHTGLCSRAISLEKALRHIFQACHLNLDVDSPNCSQSEILMAEKPSLGMMVWICDRVYIKPLPRYLPVMNASTNPKGLRWVIFERPPLHKRHNGTERIC